MTISDQSEEIRLLRQRLADAEKTITRIRNDSALTGAVPQLVSSTPIDSSRSADGPYRSIVDQMHQGAVTLTNDGDIVFANLSFANMVSVDQRELVGCNFRRFIADNHWSAYESLLGESLLGGNAQEHRQLETLLVRRDGSAVAVVLFVIPIAGNGGSTASVLITDSRGERRQNHWDVALETLRINEERYHTLFDSIDEGFCIVEILFDENSQPVDYRFVEVNSIFEQQSGLRNAIGRRMRQMVPDIEQEWMDRYGGVVRTGEPIRFVDEAKALSRWFDVYAFRLGDRDDCRVAILFKDITKQREQSAELAAARSRLVSTLAAAEIGTWEYDVSSGIVHADANLNKMFAMSSSPSDGQPVGNYLAAVHPEDRERVIAEIESTLDRCHPFECEYRLLRDDQTRFVVARGRVECGDDGKPCRLPGVVIDVTERKLYEEKLQRLAADLAENDRRKDEFLATLAHELRNPLSPIMTAAQVMQIQLRKDNMQPEQSQELVSVIERQCALMVRLINDLLDVSRISRGKFTLQKSDCQLREIVSCAIEAARPMFTASHQSLHLDVDNEEVWLSGDAARLTQVLVNLLNNAAKYTPAAGSIWLTTRREGDDAVISVRDNGIGLASDHWHRVFEMFEQVDISKERGQSGLGIGLSLVKTLVELHGGNVGVISEGLGRGCDFVVRLPVLDKPSQTSTETVDDEKLQSRSFKVLVVEDTRAIRYMMVRLLRAMGHNVEEACDGLEGYEKALTFRPDVIFSDISMPQMNGHEFAQRIRQTDALDGVRLIALTGFGQAADRENAIRHGFDDHITKPADVHRLKELFAAQR